MESFSDDEKFEVDHIVGQRKRKGVLEYLVHWKGSGDTGDSWEPAKTIASDCAQAIKSFLEAQKSQKRSKSRSKSRSRSSSRSRKAATKAGKSSRSRSRGRQEQQKATPEIKQTATPEIKQKATPEIKQTEQKEETKIIRRSLRQKAATEPETPEVKVDEKETSETIVTTSSSLNSTLTMSTTTKSSVAESDDTPRRALRSSTMDQRDTLEVQRVHNEQRPVREDDSKPRSPIWKVADYIVIILFIISLFAAIFLFLEKFVDLENFKKQAFPNLGVLKDRLAGGKQRFVELCSLVTEQISDAWLYIVEQVKRPETIVNEKAVPK